MAPFQFSIVIVTYNNIDTIKECLSSLSVSLGRADAELFLIDNASRDGTAEWLQFIGMPSFSHTVFTANARNLGFTRAVNMGLSQCRGEAILLLNPDVILEADTLSILRRNLESEPDIGAVAPKLLYPDGRMQPSCRRFPNKLHLALDLFGSGSRWRMSDFDHDHSRDVDQPQGAFLLVRREVVRRVGLLDESFPMFFSDVDWCRRIRRDGWRIRFCAGARAVHAKGASVRQRRAAMIVSSHRSFIRYFEKYDRGRRDRLGTSLLHLALLILLPLRILHARFCVQKP